MVNKFLESLTGGYTPIKIVRFAVMVCALLDSAAHLFATPAAYPVITFWLEIEVAAFIIIGIVFLLGLRMWYLPSVMFTLFNMLIYLISGVVAIAPLNPVALSGHVDFLNYSFGRAFSMATWIFIIIVGILLIHYDSGSALNTLLKNDEN